MNRLLNVSSRHQASSIYAEKLFSFKPCDRYLSQETQIDNSCSISKRVNQTSDDDFKYL